MKLYGTVVSPPQRAIMMLAYELDIKLDLVTVNVLEGEHLKPDFLKKNPQHTVPLFEDDDGFILADSHAIMGYLIGKYGGKKDSLYPKNDIKRRAIIDHRLHFDTGHTFGNGLVISKKLNLEGKQPTQEDIDKLLETFQILDAILAGAKTKFVAGDDLTIADFSIVTSVTSFGIFAPYAHLSNLKKYIERVEQLPCYKVNEEGLNGYHNLIKSKWIK